LYFWSAVGLIIAAPLVAWWLIGPLEEKTPRAGDLDYIVRAPDAPSWLTPTVGFVSLAVVTAALLNLVRRGNRERNRRWLPVVVPLVIAGVALAGIGRLVTAGADGANIGGGLALFYGLPVVAVLVGVAILRARRVPAP
jgi:hypothetical protein